MTVWTDHVKKWAREHGITYGCAISKPECSLAYRGPKPKPLNRKEKVQIEKAVKQRKEVEGELKVLYPPYSMAREYKRRQEMNQFIPLEEAEPVLPEKNLVIPSPPPRARSVIPAGMLEPPVISDMTMGRVSSIVPEGARGEFMGGSAPGDIRQKIADLAGSTYPDSDYGFLMALMMYRLISKLLVYDSRIVDTGYNVKTRPYYFSYPTKTASPIYKTVKNKNGEKNTIVVKYEEIPGVLINNDEWGAVVSKENIEKLVKILTPVLRESNIYYYLEDKIYKKAKRFRLISYNSTRDEHNQKMIRLREILKPLYDDKSFWRSLARFRLPYEPKVKINFARDTPTLGLGIGENYDDDDL